MAATQVTIKATFGDGKPLAVLGSFIEKRRQAMGETTAQAVTATAINILSSTRAATKIASLGRVKKDFVMSVADHVQVGFKSLPGQRRGKRVIRSGGHEMTGVATVNLAGKYKRGEDPHAYVVVFKYKTFRGKRDGVSYDRFYVIANDPGTVKAWAEKKIVNYVRKYSGMARWVLGQAMSRVSRRGFSESVNVEKAARRVGLGNLAVMISSDGYSKGEFKIDVIDNLRYAKTALKGGPGVLDAVMMKAANRTAGIINHQIHEMKFDGEPVETPFPELKGVRL